MRTWILQLEGEEGEVHEPTLSIKERDGEYDGVFSGDEIGDRPVKNTKTIGNAFTFTVTGELEGSDFVADCATHPRGNTLKGEDERRIFQKVAQWPGGAATGIPSTKW